MECGALGWLRDEQVVVRERICSRARSSRRIALKELPNIPPEMDGFSVGKQHSHSVETRFLEMPVSDEGALFWWLLRVL